MALGDQLAVWIEQSRDISQEGAQPIPPTIRQALTGFIPEATLDRARFKVGDPGNFSLSDAMFPRGYLSYRQGADTQAVTLDDIIIFRTENDAYTNIQLWAHELTHVDQYRRWGITTFARSYVTNPDDVETAAYQKQGEFGAWAALHQADYDGFHVHDGVLWVEIPCVSGALHVTGAANGATRRFLDMTYATPSGAVCDHPTAYQVDISAFTHVGPNVIIFAISPTTPSYATEIRIYTFDNGQKHTLYISDSDNDLKAQPRPVSFIVDH